MDTIFFKYECENMENMISWDLYIQVSLLNLWTVVSWLLVLTVYIIILYTTLYQPSLHIPIHVVLYTVLPNCFTPFIFCRIITGSCPFAPFYCYVWKYNKHSLPIKFHSLDSMKLNRKGTLLDAVYMNPLYCRGSLDSSPL